MRSLLDQLQEIGLVSEEEAKQTEAERAKKARAQKSGNNNKKPGRGKQQNKSTNKQTNTPISKPSVAEKYFADDLNKQTTVRDLLKKRGQNQHSAKKEFNFVVEGETHINAVAVTPQQQTMLLTGELAIARPLSPRDPFVLLRAKDAAALLYLEPKRMLFWEATGELDIPQDKQPAAE